MLSNRLLLVHRTIVETGTLTAAAEELGYTVSAVSQQVAQLESQAGMKLYERVGRGVRPTAAGRRLAVRADRILDEVSQAEAELADLREGRTGRVRVLTFASAGEALLPEAIAGLRARSPGLHVLPSVDETPGALRRLRSGEVDLVVVVEPFGPGAQPADDLHRWHLLADRYRLLVPSDHRLARVATVPVHELARESWILTIGPDDYVRTTRSTCAVGLGSAPRWSPKAASSPSPRATSQPAWAWPWCLSSRWGRCAAEWSCARSRRRRRRGRSGWRRARRSPAPSRSGTSPRRCATWLPAPGTRPDGGLARSLAEVLGGRDLSRGPRCSGLRRLARARAWLSRASMHPMRADEVEVVVLGLQERGIIASVHRPSLNRVCVRVVLADGSEALWDTDGALGLEAQVMANGMLVGFVPTVPGSAQLRRGPGDRGDRHRRLRPRLRTALSRDGPRRAGATVSGRGGAVGGRRRARSGGVHGPPPGRGHRRPAHRALDRRKTIIGAIVTVVTLAIIFVGIIPKFGGYADAWDQIQQMSPLALALLGISCFTMIVIYVLPYQAALPGLRYKPGFVIRQTSFMISNAIPAGGAFGLAVQFAMLRSYAVPLAAATAGIAVTSLWSVLMTLTLPVLGVLAALTTGAVRVAVGVGRRWSGLAATVRGDRSRLWLILRSEQSARRVATWGRRGSPARSTAARTDPWDATAAVLDLRNSTKDVLLTRWRWVTVSNYLVILTQFAVLWFAIRGVVGDSPDDPDAWRGRSRRSHCPGWPA